MTVWKPPTVTHPFDASVHIPGSKSLSNRYLVLAALAGRPTTIHGLLRSRDTNLMIQALKKLGAQVLSADETSTTVTVIPPESGIFKGRCRINCGLAGTVMRFVPALALYADSSVVFDGDDQAYRRPMKPLLDGLCQLGARVEYLGQGGHLPFMIIPDRNFIAQISLGEESGFETESQSDRPQEVTIDSSASSQFISGLLLAASRYPRQVIIRHKGSHLPSLPHIQMTMDELKLAGCRLVMRQQSADAQPDSGGSIQVRWSVVRWNVFPPRSKTGLQLPEEIRIEPDLSNAAPFLGAALLAGGRVSIPDWPEETTQPGGLLPQYLLDFGAHIDKTSQAADGRSYTLTASFPSASRPHGLGDYNLSAAGELAPSLAALAVVADKPTSFHGIGHLRGHETNRLAALVNQIHRVGANAEELEDGITIYPPQSLTDLHPTCMETYADHRMATFAAMLSIPIPGLTISNIETTRKTLPDFPGMWTSMIQQNYQH